MAENKWSRKQAPPDILPQVSWLNSSKWGWIIPNLTLSGIFLVKYTEVLFFLIELGRFTATKRFPCAFRQMRIFLKL